MCIKNLQIKQSQKLNPKLINKLPNRLKLLLFCLTLFLFSNSYAKKYYVDKDGRFGNGSNNNWPGTKEQPKTDFQDSWFENGLNPGDTVIVRQASYESMLFENSTGTLDKPIVVMPYPGETIIFEITIDANYAIRLNPDVSYIDIRGPIKISEKKYSYEARGYNTGLKLSNIHIINCLHGPRLSATTNSEFKDIEMEDLSENGFQLRCGDKADVGPPCENILVENVLAHDIDDGKGSKGDADGFHSFGGENIIFKNCSAWNISEDGFDLNSNAVLINCKAYDNNACALKAWRRTGDGYAEKTMTAINSIFANGGNYKGDTNPCVKVSRGAGLNLYNCVISNGYDQGLNIRVDRDDDPSGLVYLPVNVFNTIITDTQNGAAIRDEGPIRGVGSILTADYNLYYNNDRDSQGFTIGEHSIVGEDPLFADVNDLDFQILDGSPAIDAGIDLSGSDTDYQTYGMKDFLGRSRPANAAIDMGAFEYGAVLSTINLNKDELFVFPNPTNYKLYVSQPNINAEYQLYSLKGTLLKEDKLKESGIDCSNLPTGVYILKLIQDGKTTSHKIIRK